MHRKLTDQRSIGEPAGRGSGAASAVPKIIGVLLALGLLRAIVGHRGRHGGREALRQRRHEAIADFHRRLHDEAVHGEIRSA